MAQPDTVRRALESLRGMQHNPETYSAKNISACLLSVLPTFYDSSHFTACLCLVPDKYQERPEVKIVCQMEDDLSRGQFRSFWGLYNEHKQQFTINHGDFENEMRKSIAISIGWSFKSLPADVAVASANVKDAAAFIALLDTTKVQGKATGELLVFNDNDFNVPQPPPDPKKVSSADIARMIKNC